MISKKDIEDLIIFKKKNSLLNHLNILFSHEYSKYYGEIKNDEVLIWHSSFWLRYHYPIFNLKFKDDNLVALKLEKNPLQKAQELIFLIIWIIILISILLSFELQPAILTSIIYILFTTFFGLLIRDRLKKERNYLIEDFRKELEEIESNKSANSIKKREEKINKKEWNFKKTIARLVLYPFCILIVYFSATLLIPEKPVHGLLGIAVGLAYLIADIILIVKKLQPTTVHRQ